MGSILSAVCTVISTVLSIFSMFASGTPLGEAILKGAVITAVQVFQPEGSKHVGIAVNLRGNLASSGVALHDLNVGLQNNSEDLLTAKMDMGSKSNLKLGFEQRSGIGAGKIGGGIDVGSGECYMKVIPNEPKVFCEHQPMSRHPVTRVTDSDSFSEEPEETRILIICRQEDASEVLDQIASHGKHDMSYIGPSYETLADGTLSYGPNLVTEEEIISVFGDLAPEDEIFSTIRNGYHSARVPFGSHHSSKLSQAMDRILLGDVRSDWEKGMDTGTNNITVSEVDCDVIKVQPTLSNNNTDYFGRSNLTPSQQLDQIVTASYSGQGVALSPAEVLNRKLSGDTPFGELFAAPRTVFSALSADDLIGGGGRCDSIEKFVQRSDAFKLTEPPKTFGQLFDAALKKRFPDGMTTAPGTTDAVDDVYWECQMAYRKEHNLMVLEQTTEVLYIAGMAYATYKSIVSGAAVLPAAVRIARIVQTAGVAQAVVEVAPVVATYVAGQVQSRINDELRDLAVKLTVESIDDPAYSKAFGGLVYQLVGDNSVVGVKLSQNQTKLLASAVHKAATAANKNIAILNFVHTLDSAVLSSEPVVSLEPLSGYSCAAPVESMVSSASLLLFIGEK